MRLRAFVLASELPRRPVLQTAVRSLFVVVAPPTFDDDLRLIQVAEPFHVEAFVSEPTVERFSLRILPRTARLDVECLDAFDSEPRPDLVGDEFGAVIGAMVAPASRVLA